MQLKEITEKGFSFIENARKVFPDCWTADMIKSGFSAGRLKGYFAKESESITGFILFTQGVDDGDIESVFVSPEYRKRGIGKFLLSAAVEELFKGNAEKVFLEVRAGNTPAIALYISLGFAEINRRKKYYPDGEDAIIMVKEK